MVAPSSFRHHFVVCITLLARIIAARAAFSLRVRTWLQNSPMHAHVLSLLKSAGVPSAFRRLVASLSGSGDDEALIHTSSRMSTQMQ